MISAILLTANLLITKIYLTMSHCSESKPVKEATSKTRALLSTALYQLVESLYVHQRAIFVLHCDSDTISSPIAWQSVTGSGPHDKSKGDRKPAKKPRKATKTDRPAAPSDQFLNE